MSDEGPTLDPTEPQAIRTPRNTGWSSAEGVPASEPRIAHSLPGSTLHPRGDDVDVAPSLRQLQAGRKLSDLRRRTAGRELTRDERRLAEHYRRQLES